MITEVQPFDILVVDDESSTHDLLDLVARKTFAEAKFVGVTSLQDALSYLNNPDNIRPRLVLLDVDLQAGGNGLTLLPVLLERFKGRVPVVILTVSETDKDIQRAYKSGAAAYTRKPDTLQGWKEYVAVLKKYWFEITLLPPTASAPGR